MVYEYPLETMLRDPKTYEIYDLLLGVDLGAATLRKLAITEVSVVFVFDMALGSKLANLEAVVLPYFNSIRPYPKIFDLVNDEVKKKGPLAIDYRVEILSPLYPKRTMVKGEVQKVEWFKDRDLTDKVIDVTISYVRDAFGFATERTTTRTWVMSDESSYPEQKITNKVYSPNEMISEGYIRRQNIVDFVQLPTLQFLLETEQGDPNTIILMGRSFLDRMKDVFDNFVSNSSTVVDPLDPFFGQKTVVKELMLAGDLWLDNQPQALGGATIRQWLALEFSI